MNFFHLKVRSSRLKVFCKKGVQKFRRIHKTTPVVRSHFDRVTDPQATTLLKRDSNTGILQLKVATRGVMWKKLFLKISQNSQKNTSARVSFLTKLQASELQLYKKETLALVFSWEFCEIFKNTFFTEHLRTAASVL